MNFLETVNSLYKATDEITVYACGSESWRDGVTYPDIGIRAFIAGHPDHDPVIDGVRFMIAGDVFHPSYNHLRNFHDLVNLATRGEWGDVRIELRAISWRKATIDIGQYKIVGANLSDVLTLNLRRES